MSALPPEVQMRNRALAASAPPLTSRQLDLIRKMVAIAEQEEEERAAA